MTTDVWKVAKSLFREVVRRYRLPNSIVSNRDVKFVNYFWKTLWTFLWTSTLHSQTYGQIDVVNCSLRTLLTCQVGERRENWVLLLPNA